MNTPHPSTERWMDFLYEELPRADREALKAHLEACPDCRVKVEQWHQAMGGLDTWVLPKSKRRSWTSLPMIRWAAAASILFGLGLALGVMGGRWGQRQALVQEMTPLIRQELQKELTEAWRTELADWRQQVYADMMRVQQATAQGTREDVSGVLAQWTQAIQDTRSQDQQATLKLCQQMEERHEADIAWLRRDLETVALQADGEFRLTRHKLGQLLLASQSPAFQIDTTSPEKTEQN
ncbi:MAG TPA: zf-HC2 domain-containing protein [Candidatus Paceibacterota bacterium]|nr:zf-HC2 domain-containing protein [Verrucomicrobiota bacterium]HRY50193.1 zf-HC2 domain-containing protein [Candidatus Paceibacterota bacterium]HSA01304.1 zf-HC2 domain-containing protein [Candidatus Paceibacterota bacterium]